MIEVKINLVPYGVYDAAHQIGYIKIWNDATGTAEIGNYGYEIKNDYGDLIVSGEYKDHKRGAGIFILLKDILNDAYSGV